MRPIEFTRRPGFTRRGDARQKFVLPHFGRHGRNELVNHAAPAIHQKRLRRPIHAPIDGRTIIGVESHRGVRVSQLFQPLLRFFALVHVDEPDDGHLVLLCDLEQRFVLLPAGLAPSAPHVDDVYLTLECRIAHGPVRIHYVRERDRGRGFTDQRRWQRVDIAFRIEAESEQHRQRNESRKRQEILPHHAPSSFGSGLGGAVKFSRAGTAALER
jgi:hypothetical protein